MMEFKYQITKENDNETIESFLLKNNFSKKEISAIKYQGGYTLVNRAKQNVSYVLHEGDCLLVKLHEEQLSTHYAPIFMPLDIVYEDEYLLIINKKPGLDTIPTKRNNDYSLANGLKEYFQKQHIQSNIHFINRLDKFTSGLIMVAKNGHIHNVFSQIEITKKYLAFVKGKIYNSQMIEGGIRRESETSMRRIVCETGLSAKTLVIPLKLYDDYSLVELTLFTGRTHQIRVHLTFIHHPLLGDELYGGPCDLINRQALHSYYVHFFHPFLKKDIEITAALPCDMKKLETTR